MTSKNTKPRGQRSKMRHAGMVAKLFKLWRRALTRRMPVAECSKRYDRYFDAREAGEL